MADWFSIPNTSVDPDAPVTSNLMYALRDNPIAIAEGATGAPRVTQSAILNPSVGNFRTINRVYRSITTSSTETVDLAGISCFLPGAFRVSIIATGSLTSYTISRLRNGTSTTLVNSSSAGTYTHDIPIAIGDKVYVRMTVGSSSPSSVTGSVDASLQIGNDSLGFVVL